MLAAKRPSDSRRGAPPRAETPDDFKRLLAEGHRLIDITPAIREATNKILDDIDFARRTGRCPKHKDTELKPSPGPVVSGVGSPPHKFCSCPECGFTVRMELTWREEKESRKRQNGTFFHRAPV